MLIRFLCYLFFPFRTFQWTDPTAFSRSRWWRHCCGPARGLSEHPIFGVSVGDATSAEPPRSAFEDFKIQSDAPAMMLRHLTAPAKVMAHDNTEVRVKEKEQQSEQLVAMLGQPFDNKKIRQALGSLGVKRYPSPDGTMSEDIVRIPKASVRIDVYRAQKLSALTGTDYPDQDGSSIGAVQFLAPGSDDRIKMPFPQLPSNGPRHEFEATGLH